MGVKKTMYIWILNKMFSLYSVCDRLCVFVCAHVCMSVFQREMGLLKYNVHPLKIHRFPSVESK